MAGLFELKQQREAALAKADGIVSAAERANRALTAPEERDVNGCMAEVQSLNPQIAGIEKVNTIRGVLNAKGQLIPGNPNSGRKFERPSQRVLTAEYPDAFLSYVSSYGKEVHSALYEGSDGAGGFAVPTLTDGQIVPLAPQEMGIRQLATVIPTVNDIKLPIKSAHGTAAAKAESSGSNNAFGGTEPTLTQKTLSAFMGGAVSEVSWELTQDVSSFQTFAVDDLILDVQQYEEPLFISGSGNGEPEGVLTGADTGVNLPLSISATLDLVGTLNAIYHPNAAFLMQRLTAVQIRKLQLSANLFEPVWTRVGDKDYFHGYRVSYSGSMPGADTNGHKAIVFGDFKRGFVIGDRGGSGINVKILDQPKATLGILQLLAYRRTDSRVRRSEALKTFECVVGSGS